MQPTALGVQALEAELPVHIARCIRRYRTTDPDDVSAKHDLLGDAFEAVVKTLAVFALQDIRGHGKMSTRLEQAVQGMLHPALGHWVALLRLASGEAVELTPAALQLRQWLSGPVAPKTREATLELKEYFAKEGPACRTIGELVDLLTNYRNKVWKGHGARLTQHEYAERLGPLEASVFSLLETAPLLSTLSLFYVEEVQVLPTGEYKHKVKSVKGTDVEPFALVQATALLPSRVYAQGAGPQSARPFPLGPFLAFAVCRECRSEQVLVFNDLRKGQPEFLSYGCGHFAYPDLLASEVSQLLDVAVGATAAGEAGVLGRESSQKASALRLSGAEAISREDYPAALRHLRESLALDRNAGAAVLAALCAVAEGSNLEQGRMFTDMALAENPREEAALLLNERLTIALAEGRTDGLRELAQDWLLRLVYRPRAMTLFDAIMPRAYAGRWIPFVLAITVPGTILLSLGAGNGQSGEAPILLARLGLVLSVTLTFHLLLEATGTIFFALSRQVESAPGFDFGKWYEGQVRRIFGAFRSEGGWRERLGLDQREGLRYAMLVAILFIIAMTGAAALQCGTLRDRSCVLGYSGGNLFPILLSVFVAPSLSRMFTMFRAYARLSLRPLVGASGALAFQEVGDAIVGVSLAAIGAFLSMTAMGWYSFSPDVVTLQLLLWALLLTIGTLWTTGVPVSLWLALRTARGRPLARFSQHLRDAMEDFLKRPGDDSASRFEGLVKHEALLRTLRNWPFASGVTLMLVFLNLFIVLIAIAYPLLKFGS